MPGMESQLNLAQHRLGLVALLGQLTRGDFAPRADRLHEGSICEFVLTCSLVTLTRALIGALLEKAVTESPRFLLGRHRTRCARLRHRIGEGHGCGYQQETKANQKTEPDDAQASRERCDPVSGADRWEFDRRESVKHATAEICAPQQEPGQEEDYRPQGPEAVMRQHDTLARPTLLSSRSPGYERCPALALCLWRRPADTWRTTAATHFRERWQQIRGMRSACIAAGRPGV